MDDRKLREYAFKIYKGESDYSLQKAFRLFPKYYPKIAFFYTELLTKQQNEFSLQMIQALGIDKGKALLNELNNLNVRMSKFYVNAKFKIDESYRRLEAATDEYDRKNAKREELNNILRITEQSIDFHKQSTDLINKIYDEAQKYKFVGLENDLINAAIMSNKKDVELYKLSYNFRNYIKQYQT